MKEQTTHQDPEPQSPQFAQSHRINRRRMVGMTSAAIVAPLAPGAAAIAHQRGASTPAAGTTIDASPVAGNPVDIDTLLALSTRLVGVEELDPDTASILAQLIGSDPARVAGFEELAQVDDPTDEGARAGLSDSATTVINDILQFWYLGYFDDQPVEQRADIFFGLPTWRTVPYATIPSACKGFGYWANEVELDER